MNINTKIKITLTVLSLSFTGSIYAVSTDIKSTGIKSTDIKTLNVQQGNIIDYLKTKGYKKSSITFVNEYIIIDDMKIPIQDLLANIGNDSLLSDTLVENNKQSIDSNSFSIGNPFNNQCESDHNYDYTYGHRVGYNKVNDSIVTNLKWCSSSVPVNWEDSLQAAINDINIAASVSDSKIHVSWTTSGDECDTIINFSEKVTTKSGFALFPSNGKPGSQFDIYISNVSHFPTDFAKRGVIIHEGLHTLGFYHTGHYIGKQVPNTDGYYDTANAGKSLMCALADPNDRPNHANYLDQRALKHMYPE